MIVIVSAILAFDHNHPSEPELMAALAPCVFLYPVRSFTNILPHYYLLWFLVRQISTLGAL